MDINLNITFRLPPALEQLLVHLVTPVHLPSSAPVASPADDDTDDLGIEETLETPKPRRGRPRKAAAAAVADVPSVDTVIAPKQPEPPKELPSGPVLQKAEVAALITGALKAVGVAPLRGVFDQFGVSRFDDLPAAKYGEFAKALTALTQMVGK